MAIGSGARTRLGPGYWRLWTASVVSNLGDGIAFIAYPWLASAVTRNAFLIALIAVMQRLPWLVFTLPAGVITDRVDRRKLIVGMDLVRGALTLVVAASVVANEGRLPAPEAITSGVDVATNLSVYLVLLVASLLFGFAEVLRDNAAQTIIPALVEQEHLEKANGNLWGAEMVANSFVGPPLGSVLLAVGFAVPFFVDAATFFVAAALIMLIAGSFRAERATSGHEPVGWLGEVKEGVAWLWGHQLLRPLAITLGVLNGLGMVSFATFVLFAQENLDLETGLGTGLLSRFAEAFGFESIGALVFAVVMTGGAIGGVIGSVAASRVSARLGPGGTLWLTMVGAVATGVIVGAASRWWIVFAMNVVAVFTAMVWNVITVSLRQTIIPDALLGRVNSVYRFLGWGMMPIGSAIGGVTVAVADGPLSREAALRLPWFVSAAGAALLLLYAAPRLTTARIETAKAEAAVGREAAGSGD